MPIWVVGRHTRGVPVARRQKRACGTTPEACLWHGARSVPMARRQKRAYGTTPEACLWHDARSVPMARRQKRACGTTPEACLWHGAPFQQGHGEVVAQRVQSDRLGDASRPCRLLEPSQDLAGGQVRAAIARENDPFRAGPGTPASREVGRSVHQSRNRTKMSAGSVTLRSLPPLDCPMRIMFWAPSMPPPLSQTTSPARIPHP